MFDLEYDECDNFIQGKIGKVSAIYLDFKTNEFVHDIKCEGNTVGNNSKRSPSVSAFWISKNQLP